jgi:hypothetical protein
MKSIKLNTKVIEWVLFKIRLAFFQLYHEIMLALSKTNQFRWMLIVLVHSKYQCYSHWLDPTVAQTHDLAHTRRAC